MTSARHSLYIYERSHIYDEEKHKELLRFYEKELKQKKENLKEIIDRFKKGDWEKESRSNLIKQIKRENILILKAEQIFIDIKKDFKTKKKTKYID